MSTSTIHINQPKEEALKITWEQFQKEYLVREDNYKYEWVDGQVQKTLKFEYTEQPTEETNKKSQQEMYENQFFIFKNLLDFFFNLKIENRQLGYLMAEGDTFFSGQHRRPDIAYYTAKQIEAARKGENKIPPQFVIEIISTNDQMNLVHLKMRDYWSAGVKVVWHILPALQEIHVYNGKKMEVLSGEDICSAASVIAGFEIKVEEVFR